MTEEDPAARAERLRKKNRVALFWLTGILLAIAGAGFAFGRWLLEHPPKSGMH